MALAKFPITIVRDDRGRIIKCDIPKSQTALMNSWLDENNYQTWKSGVPALAAAIERYYPGGLEGWSRDAAYPIEFKKGRLY